MISIRRTTTAWLGATALSLFGLAGESSAQSREPSGDDQLMLPAVPVVGWRVGTTLYGGWDSNPRDVPDGPSDRDYDLRAAVAVGSQGRRGVFGLSAEGSRLLYEELKDRNAWTGAAALTLGRRLSRSAVFSLDGGLRYDYTDQFLTVPGISAQLPRTVAFGGYGTGQVALQVARRTVWSNEVRYESINFEGEGLTDTTSLRVRSILVRRVARRDSLSATYEFLHARWGTAGEDNHAGLAGWMHGFSDRWSLTIESGASHVVSPDPVDPRTKWLWTGGAVLTGKKADRAILDLSYRRSATPGYGVGQLLYSDVVQASAVLPVGGPVELQVSGAVDRSHDPFDPSYRVQGAYVDARVGVRIAGSLGVVTSYRYHHREYSGQLPSIGQRVGVALTTMFESRRRVSRGEGSSR